MISKLHLQDLETIQEALRGNLITIGEIQKEWIEKFHESNKYLSWSTVIKEPSLSHSEKEILSGLLIGVKDNIATREFPTSMGTTAWTGTPGGFDARVISRLRNFGVTIVGKTRCSEFAVHERTGTVNPRYPDSEPGTSSSGSAAAVAGEEISVSLGTQTAGSIAKPASYCGVIGFKPTFGDIPRTGVLKTTEMFDSVGFFGRRISDLSKIYRVSRVAGKDFPIHEKTRSTYIGKDFKYLCVLSGPEIDCPSPALTESFTHRVNEVASKFNLELLPELSFDFQRLRNSLYAIYHRDLNYFLYNHHKNGNISKNLKMIVNHGSLVSRKEYGESKSFVEKWRKTISTLPDSTLLLSLSTSSSAPKIGHDDSIDANFFITSAGLPQLSLPLLRDEHRKLVGLSISSNRFSDDLLLQIGHLLFPFDALTINS